MTIEDKRKKVPITAIKEGDIFQFVDILQFTNKYFLWAEDNQFVDIETGDIYSLDSFCERQYYGINPNGINVTVLNVKLVID